MIGIGIVIVVITRVEERMLIEVIRMKMVVDRRTGRRRRHR